MAHLSEEEAYNGHRHSGPFEVQDLIAAMRPWLLKIKDITIKGAIHDNTS